MGRDGISLWEEKEELLETWSEVYNMHRTPCGDGLREQNAAEAIKSVCYLNFI